MNDEDRIREVLHAALDHMIDAQMLWGPKKDACKLIILELGEYVADPDTGNTVARDISSVELVHGFYGEGDREWSPEVWEHVSELRTGGEWVQVVDHLDSMNDDLTKLKPYKKPYKENFTGK